MKRISGAAVLYLMLFLSSCSPLTLFVPDTPEWDFMESLELPAGIVRASDTQNAVWILDTKRVLADTAPEGAVSKQYLVPAVDWTDTRTSVTSAELVHQGIELIPLSEIRLPRKILSVDGFYPGDTGYPLFEWSVTFSRPGDKFDRISSRRRIRGESDLQEFLSGLERPGDDSLRITGISAVGDIMPGRGFGELLLGPEGVELALGNVAPLLRDSDYLIGNLETAVTDSDKAEDKSYNFKVSRAVLQAVVNLGFDYFHLANNHSWDYGERGFRDTLDALEQSGVGFSGAGPDIDGARFFQEVKASDGTVIRILSLGAYYRERNGFDGASAAAAGQDKPGVLWDSPENEPYIRSALGGRDVFTIVTVHGGYEWEDEPREDIKEMYRRYVDWGADLVLAHHPHVLQGIEHYQNGLIAYSLGNFIFPGMGGWYTGEETGVLEFRLYQGRIVGVDFHPVRINDIRLSRADTDGIAERFWQMSAVLNSRSAPDE